MIKHKSRRTMDQLNNIAENALQIMPVDLTPAELAYVISRMLNGHALALRREETL